MRKTALNKNKLRKNHNKIKMELEKKNNGEEYRYCLKQIGQ
jgi:hypothetical protein